MGRAGAYLVENVGGGCCIDSCFDYDDVTTTLYSSLGDVLGSLKQEKKPEVGARTPSGQRVNNEIMQHKQSKQDIFSSLIRFFLEKKKKKKILFYVYSNKKLDEFFNDYVYTHRDIDKNYTTNVH